VKTQLVTAPARHDHPPQPAPPPETHSVRRVGLLDRAALHLGVALIRWGRRSMRVDTSEQFAMHAEVLEARLEMERTLAEHAANVPRFR
jgi:hypothetical protein